MLSQAQRTTILELNAKQVSKREIARVMGAAGADWLERPERGLGFSKPGRMQLASAHHDFA